MPRLTQYLVTGLGYTLKNFAGQRVIGEPVVSGLVLDDSWLWDPDFTIASK